MIILLLLLLLLVVVMVVVLVLEVVEASDVVWGAMTATVRIMIASHPIWPLVLHP